MINSEFLNQTLGGFHQNWTVVMFEIFLHKTSVDIHFQLFVNFVRIAATGKSGRASPATLALFVFFQACIYM